MPSKFLNLDIDTTLGGSNASDTKVASQKAIKTYVDAHSGGTPAFVNITGDPYDNTNLASALNAKVSDVTIDGTTIVSSGVAQIPNASGSVTGVVKLSANLTSISNTIAATASMGNTLAKNIITGVDIYSSSSTYSVGDKVRYGQYYYECITAITTAHAWDENEWQEITIQGQIDEKVDDVTVNGTSVVTNGTATIPIAQQSGDYGLVKLGSTSSGLQIASGTGNLSIYSATSTNIDEKTNTNRPIVSSNLDYAVKVGVTTNTNALTDSEQSSANKWLGSQKKLVAKDGGGAVDIVEVFNLPLGYTQLDYIYNTANSTKLDLGIKPQDGDVIETIFMVKKTGVSNYYLQARETTSSYIYGIGGGSANTVISSSMNNYSAVSSSVQRAVDHKYYLKTSFIDGTITLNIKDLTTDVEETTTTSYTFASINANYYLWGSGVQTLNAVQPCQLVRITNGSTVRACIVPATDGTDVGFYDTVNNTFITTMTAGTVTGGNPVLGTISVPPATVGGDYGAVKIDSADYGIGIHTNGFLTTSYATTSNITNKNATYKPITPVNLDLAVKTGVTTNTITLTTEEKTAALSWLGAQASGTYVNDVTVDGTSVVTSGTAAIPIAEQSGSYGLVKLRTTGYGLQIASDGALLTISASSSNIVNKDNSFKPLTSTNVDEVVKVGITTNAITLTDAEKTAALTWLGASRGAVKRVWYEA